MTTTDDPIPPRHLKVDREVTMGERVMLSFAEKLALYAADVIRSGEELRPIVHALALPAPGAGLVDEVYDVASVFTRETEDARPAALRELFAQRKVGLYCLASEVWTLAGPVTGGLPDHRISEDDRRVSALMISGECLSGEIILGVWRIAEGAKREVDLDHPIMLTLNEEEVGGRMQNLLPRVRRAVH